MSLLKDRESNEGAVFLNLLGFRSTEKHMKNGGLEDITYFPLIFPRKNDRVGIKPREYLGISGQRKCKWEN